MARIARHVALHAIQYGVSDQGYLVDKWYRCVYHLLRPVRSLRTCPTSKIEGREASRGGPFAARPD